MQGWIRAIWRFFYFAIATTFHILGFLVAISFGKAKTIAGPQLRMRWLSHVPERLGMKMKVEGHPYQGTCLYVANHIGYIDPFVILVHVKASVVAKAEILNWPLVGLGGNMAGTIFVKREVKSSRQETVEAIRMALQQGISILIFPEGTTTSGNELLSFRPRAFESAFQAGVPVQPISISYESPLVAYIGDHTFLPHFFKLFRLKYIRGKVSFGPLLRGDDTCNRSRDWIQQAQSNYIRQSY